MRTVLLKKLFLVGLFIGCTFYVNAQQYYAVVGAFRKETNAKKFAGFVKSRFFQATYELHPTRKLFYVYALKSSDRSEVLEQVRNLQKEDAFSDAWFFRGKLGTEPIPVVEKIEPVVPEPVIKPEEPVIADSIVVDTLAVDNLVVETSPEKAPLKAKGKFFKFVITDLSGKPVAGNVHHVDLRRGRDLASYKSNEYSDVPRPNERDVPMSVVCGIFGYKEITQLIDYTNPSLTTGAVVDEEGIWTIPFALERLNKGDMTVMYDVSFYKDAVIMTPRSQEELDELVDMMNSNTNYVIKIHGHCNGKKKRKIVALGESRNYFDIKGSKDKNGSAKELSKLRAEAIRDYLVEHGIAKNRMEIMEWGGMNMLVSETSPSAKLNDRIEIEILKD